MINVYDKWSPIFESIGIDKSRYLVLAKYCEEHSKNDLHNTVLYTTVNRSDRSSILPFCIKVLGNIVAEASQIIFTDGLSFERDNKLVSLLDESPSFELKREEIYFVSPISDLSDLPGGDVVMYYESTLNKLVQERINKIIQENGEFVFSYDFLKNLGILEDPNQVGYFRMSIDLKYIKAI